jgi:hypothetical protein
MHKLWKLFHVPWYICSNPKNLIDNSYSEEVFLQSCYFLCNRFVLVVLEVHFNLVLENLFLGNV